MSDRATLREPLYCRSVSTLCVYLSKWTRDLRYYRNGSSHAEVNSRNKNISLQFELHAYKKASISEETEAILRV